MKRTIEFKFNVIRDGATFCELFPSDGTAPRIEMSDHDVIKSSFSGSFSQPEKLVDWLTDRISPEIVVDGVSHKLGVFLPVSVQEINDGTSSSLLLSALDQGWIVRDTKTTRLVYFPAGTNYVDAVVSLLAEAGVAMINETETSEVLPEAREDWDLGTSVLDIVNQLLSEINYAPVWFDQNGAAVIAPYSTPTAINISHVLDENEITSLLLPGIQTSTDIIGKPNVFICICSNADKTAPMVAVAENTNPQSPLSIARRGRRITEVTFVDNIASQEALQTFANRKVTDCMLSGEIFTVQTCLLPGFGVGDVTAIRYGDLMAVCRESGWEMDLATGGTMTHTLERTVLNIE